MPILKRLKELFDQTKVPYEVFNHPMAYTAQEIAATQHVSGNEMAKVVILEADGSLVMAVIAANHKISLDKARESLGSTHLRLATEDEFMPRFSGCEIGAMPPFGALFGLETVVDPALAKNKHIYFNGGSHVQTVRLSYKDFIALAKPKLMPLVGMPKKLAA